MPMPLRVCPKNMAHADHFLVEMPQVSPPRAWLQGCFHAAGGENGQGALDGEWGGKTDYAGVQTMYLCTPMQGLGVGAGSRTPRYG